MWICKKRCIDCGKKVSRNHITRCILCRLKWARGINAPNWQGGNYCVDCKIKISKSAERCVSCSNERLKKVKNNSRALGKRWKLQKPRKRWSKEALHRKAKYMREFWLNPKRKAEISRKISKTLMGRKLSNEHVLKMSGPNHYAWNPNREEVRHDRRNDPEYKQFVKKVKKRDGECRLKSKECYGYNVVHHIKSWRKYPKLRYELINGITLCQYHHPRKRFDEQRLIPIFKKLVGSN